MILRLILSKSTSSFLSSALEASDFFAVSDFLSSFLSSFLGSSFLSSFFSSFTVSSSLSFLKIVGVFFDKIKAYTLKAGLRSYADICKPELLNPTLVLAVKNKYRSEEHTSELQSRENLVCRLLLEKK